MEAHNGSDTGAVYELADYTLTDGYSIRSANRRQWGIHFAVYYSMEYNGFFKDEGYRVQQNRPAYWIYSGETKVGGVVIAANIMYHLFFIPPFNEQFQVIMLLKQLLMQWSDQAEPIKVIEVLPDQVELFSRAGFWPDTFRCRWMQRPTEQFDLDWGEELRLQIPNVIENEAGVRRLAHAHEIVQLYHDGGKEGINVVRRIQTIEHVIDEFEQYPNYTNEDLLAASTLIYDIRTNKLVAGCFISLQGEYPAVYDITVLPSHRRKGLATKMLKRALSLLQDKYPVLRLYVMQGNDAESLYYNLGFMPGPVEVQNCHIPARTP